MDREALEAALRESRAGLLRQIESASAAQASLLPAADEWSVIEILAHLVDTDYYYLGEALAMRDSHDHHFRYFDDESWKRTHPEVRRLPLDAVLDALAISHRTVLRVLATMDAEELSKRGTHPRGITYTVQDVLYRLVPHDGTHEQQIRDALRT